MIEPRYPEITVSLTGHDGNAMRIIGAVREALRRGGVDAEEVTEFSKEAMAGDYNNLIQVVMDWVEVD